MKYRFIENNRSNFGVEEMCRILGASRSGYYDWRRRGPSERELRHERLLPEIERIFRDNRKVYGSPRIFEALRVEGKRYGLHQIEIMMREHNITPPRRKKYKRTTNSEHTRLIVPNLVEQAFEAAVLNRLWTSDITYIWTNEGWLYLAVVLDVRSRRIVGWNMNHRLKDELVIGAIEQALSYREVTEGLILHSDRGSQYASLTCRKLLSKHRITQSMSGQGNCYDNAITESFFATLKTELVYLERFETREEARLKVFDFIEIFYNRQRSHSSLGYKSPVDFEKKETVS
jgi:transposase InsO family protein